jgi:dihydrofolate reductase
VALIVAVSENGVIGRDNQLPFRLREDLRRFRRLTLHHTIIMGRATWESIGKPLPGRSSIVLSRDRSYRAPGAAVAATLEEALGMASSGERIDRVFVIGGASVYAAALPVADELFLTRVHAEVEGDVHFPLFEQEDWRVVSAERTEKDEHNEFETTFYHLRRAAP